MLAVKKFHDYLYGCFFQLFIDHKPLLGLLSGDRQTPQIMPPCLSHWSIILAAYNYQLIRHPGKALGNADGLSHCPLPLPVSDPAPGAPVFLVDEWDVAITALDIAKSSQEDLTIAQVLDWVRQGWPRGCILEEFRPYEKRQHELSVLR